MSYKKYIMKKISIIIPLIIWSSFGSLLASQGIKNPHTYEKTSHLQWIWATESLGKFPIEETDKVLDIGCGNGKITAYIAEKVPKGCVVGFDISEEMLSFASSNYAKSNLVFILGNANSIPFNQQFDKLFTSCTLHWILEQEQALLSFKKCLKPGGAMLLILPGKAPSNFGEVARDVAATEKWVPYFPNFKQERVYFTSEEYRSLLESLGIKIESLEVSETITKYVDKSTFITYITTLCDFMDHLTPDLQNEFIHDVATLQIDKSNLNYNDGSVGIRTIKIEVIAINE
jgi:trans-aconitate 2-methyltransferase